MENIMSENLSREIMAEDSIVALRNTNQDGNQLTDDEVSIDFLTKSYASGWREFSAIHGPHGGGSLRMQKGGLQ